VGNPFIERIGILDLLPDVVQMKSVDACLTQKTVKRLPFIDFVRGVAMVLMAWDHVSLFWNPGHRGSEGLMGARPLFLNFTQFFLRFITHYCAPIFIFLAGTSLALSTTRRVERGESQQSIAMHIAKRGGVLLLLAVFVESAAFGTSPLYFGVISCIGLCLIIFGVLRRLPPLLILALSTLIIVAHPLLNLDWIPKDTPGGFYLRVIIHEPSYERYPFVGLYPIIPWLGVMGLGWYFGTILTTYDWTTTRRLTSSVLASGLASLVLWFFVRLINGYGNLLPRLGDSLQDWLYMAKYPPSLDFLLWTLGGMCLLLALGLILQGRAGFDKGLTGAISTFGRTPLFFYLTHLWLYRLKPGWMTQKFLLLDLWTTAAFWFVGLLILWRLCIRYERLKSRHPDSLLQYI